MEIIVKLSDQELDDIISSIRFYKSFLEIRPDIGCKKIERLSNLITDLAIKNQKTYHEPTRSFKRN